MAAPSGIASFLLTDVEGSTRLWQSDPQGMAASLALHDEILRRVIEAHDGYIFSTAGDAFAAAFPTTAAALQAATRAQVDLESADWPGPPIKVRMGIHTGEAQERGGNYFGPVVNRAARIMAAGQGGRVLVSHATAEMAHPDLTGIALRDLGEHRLRDLDASEQVFEIEHPDLPRIDEPLQTAGMRKDNLPEYLTSFVGRTAELDDVARLIESNRLVVLSGVGGTGKTRLAVEAGRRALLETPDGVWLTELAAITDPGLVMTAIGDTWDLRPGEFASIDEVVTRYLWSKEALVVLDNCEHLLGAAAGAITTILARCPKIRVLATSRESLGIPGEALFHVPSLGLPDPDQADKSDAVRLFLDRARAVDADFDPDSEEMQAIERICWRIDGIPLGLELAAARLRSMSPRELADHLDDSFRILSGSAKTALPRQRTLAATIDWSHDLLEPEEATLFRRISVFSGGFTLAAAEAVCAGEGMESEIVDLLDSLVDKSLAITDRGQDTRYRLLEPVRQYAQERLSASGEAKRVRLAHARYFAGFARQASPHLRGPDHQVWAARIDRDYGNLRAALVSLLEDGDTDASLDMAFDAFIHWMHTGRHLEGIAAGLENLEAAPDTTDPTRLIKGWWTTAMLGAEITRPQSVEHARAGLAIAEGLDDPNALGRMELALGAAIRHSTTDPEYLEHLIEGRRLLDEHPEPHWWEPVWERAFIDFICAAYLPSTDDRKAEHAEAALAGFEEVGDQAMVAATLGESVSLLGTVDTAIVEARLERAIELFETVDSPYWHGHALYYLGVVRCVAGDLAGAAPVLAAGATRLEDSGDLNCWAGSSRYLAIAEASLGSSEQAARRLAATIDALPQLPMQDVQQARALDSAIEVLRDPERAALALGKAQTLEIPPSVIPRDEWHARARERLVAKLGEDRVQQIVDEGAEVEIDDILGEIRGWLTE